MPFFTIGMNEGFIWEAPEYGDEHKSRDWFGVVGIVGVGGAVLAIIFGNVLFAALIVLATIALFLEGLRRPHVIEFEIDKRGARAGNILYPFQDLASFWIETEDEPEKLLLKSEKTLMPLIVFPIAEEISLEELHTFLNERLEEEPLSEPAFEHILRRFGF